MCFLILVQNYGKHGLWVYYNSELVLSSVDTDNNSRYAKFKQSPGNVTDTNNAKTIMY